MVPPLKKKVILNVTKSRYSEKYSAQRGYTSSETISRNFGSTGGEKILSGNFLNLLRRLESIVKSQFPQYGN